MSEQLDRPFDLEVVVLVDPKPGHEVITEDGNTFIVGDGTCEKYDPEQVIARLNDLLRSITRDDDGYDWQIHGIHLKWS